MIIETQLGSAAGGGGGMAQINYVQESPVEGGTVTAPNNTLEIVAWLTPAGPLNAITFELPEEGHDRIGQRALIGCSEAVQSMLVTNGGGTVYNADVLLSEGDCVVFLCMAPGVWSRAV